MMLLFQILTMGFGKLLEFKIKPNTRFNLTFFLSQTHVKRMLNGRCAPVQWATEYPPVVRRTAPSNTRIKLTAKLKSLKPFSLLAAYPPPIRLTCLKAGWCGTDL